MNIHFTDKKLFEQLKFATLATVRVGSHMYGNNNENSDEDFLYIYATSKNEVNSFLETHHQLQYKENNVDYNFVSLHTFIQNIFNGDSTINFEVVQSDALLDTHLEWLTKHKEVFITYSMIRSYLGLARRDIKHYHKCKSEYEKRKRLGHIIRGYLYATDMIYNELDFNLVNRFFCTKVKDLDVSTNKTLREYETLISDLRDKLNEKFNGKTLGLAQTMDVELGKKLMKDFLMFCNSDIFETKQSMLDNFNLDEFINVNENWVAY